MSLNEPMLEGMKAKLTWKNLEKGTLYQLSKYHPHNILVTTVNSVGLVMYICYNIVYLRYANNQKRKSMCMYYLAEVVFSGCLDLYHTPCVPHSYVKVYLCWDLL